MIIASLLFIFHRHGNRRIIARPLTAFFVALLPLLLSSRAIGQFPSPDTLAVDSLSYPVADTSRARVDPIPFLGSVDRTEHIGTVVIPDTAFPFIDYRAGSDLLRLVPGYLPRELGGPGQSIGLTLFGVEHQAIAVMQDGIILNDPLTGFFNPDLLPMESIQRVEVITGPRAFLYGENSTGGVVNVATKHRRSIHAYSHIRYSEATHGFGALDAMVSQDILRGLTVTAGVSHPTYNGNFRNMAYDSWIPRLSARYDISNALNLFASGFSVESKVGQNGGVDLATPDSLRFEGLQALVRSDSSYEKVSRKELHAGAAIRIPGDTTGVSTLVGFLSTQLREFRSGRNPGAIRSLTEQDHHTQRYGMRLTHTREFLGQGSEFGFEIQNRAVIAGDLASQDRRTSVSAFGRISVAPLPNLRLSPYGRIENNLGQSTTGVGGDVTLRPADALTFGLGISRSYRFPTFQERSWGSAGNDTLFSAPPTGATPERHELLEASVRYYAGDNFQGELVYDRRTIHDALVVIPQPTIGGSAYTLTSVGEETRNAITLSVRGRLGPFYLESSGQYLTISSPVRSQFLPLWHWTGGLYYWDRLVDGHLRLKAGFQGRYFSAFDGEGFDGKDLLFLPAQPVTIRTAAVVDFVLIAHIGDAYLHVIWENLFDRDYLTTVFYPMPGRAIRFGIGWAFLD